MAEAQDLLHPGEVDWPELGRLVERHLGLHYPPQRQCELESLPKLVTPSRRRAWKRVIVALHRLERVAG